MSALPQRKSTRTLKLGPLLIGGGNPIVVQSMTNTDTRDPQATLAQINALNEAGCQLVRLAVPDIRAANALREINDHSPLPLVADIHFDHRLALAALESGLLGLRINPGNLDKANDGTVGLDRLTDAAKAHNAVIRIGVNSGSVEKDLLERFGGPTPSAMVESAIRHIHLLEDRGFENIKISLKSSSVLATVEAYRLMSTKTDYPLHLGVTEAGSLLRGSIKSAVGMGVLLFEGIGDTIRVSLSESPEEEIPVAKKLVDYYLRGGAESKPTYEFKPPANKPLPLRRINVPLVIATETDKNSDFIMDKKKSVVLSKENKTYPLFSAETFQTSALKSDELNFLLADSNFSIQFLKELDAEKVSLIFTLNPYKEKFALDTFLKALGDNNLSYNVILNPVFNENDIEELRIKAPALFGRYLNDKQITGICISNDGTINACDITSLAFSILQCVGLRITRTVYISCPTCGRTKFNLADSVKKVKKATGHLKGLKIAIMGCIVNGPGEMAGADYGYVGAGAGKVHIYKGTDLVLKNVPEENAVGELLKLIENDSITI